MNFLKMLSIVVLFFSTDLFADGLVSQPNAVEKGIFQKIGGQYIVHSIKRIRHDEFVIEFHSTVKNGKADVVKLVADHVHAGVKLGQSIRISAEIDSELSSVVNATQVLLFLPRPEGPVPVWLMSKKGRGRDLNGSKYLEMHAPQSDYVIL